MSLREIPTQEKPKEEETKRTLHPRDGHRKTEEGTRKRAASTELNKLLYSSAGFVSKRVPPLLDLKTVERSSFCSGTPPQTCSNYLF
jgi:hypothetical protein